MIFLHIYMRLMLYILTVAAMSV